MDLNSPSRIRSAVASLFGLVASTIAIAAPTTQPTSKSVDTPKGSFELTEWVIFVVDPNRPDANDASAFKSTVPGFARGRRPSPASADAMKSPSPVSLFPLRLHRQRSGFANPSFSTVSSPQPR